MLNRRRAILCCCCRDLNRPNEMKTRLFLSLAGAAGIVLAALFYFCALQAQGALKFLLLIADAGVVIFVLLLLVSLIEIGAMTFALMRLAKQLTFRMIALIAAGYVAFAGVYAIGYALLVPDVRGTQILAVFCVVRWFTLWFVRV